jgi:hypothetical protein
MLLHGTFQTGNYPRYYHDITGWHCILMKKQPLSMWCIVAWRPQVRYQAAANFFTGFLVGFPMQPSLGPGSMAALIGGCRG